MKKLLVAAALFVGGLSAGCSSPCDVLADLCAKCKDQTTKRACEQAVATYRAIPLTSNTSCQAALDARTFSSCE